MLQKRFVAQFRCTIGVGTGGDETVGTVCASGVGSRKRLRFKAGVAEMNVRSIAPPPRPAPSPTVGAGKKESSSSNATDAASTLLRSAQSVKAMRGSLGGIFIMLSCHPRLQPQRDGRVGCSASPCEK